MVLYILSLCLLRRHRVVPRSVSPDHYLHGLYCTLVNNTCRGRRDEVLGSFLGLFLSESDFAQLSGRKNL